MLRLTALLGRRQQLFGIFRAASPRSAALPPLGRLVAGADLDGLEGRVPRGLLREWAGIDAELDGAPMRRVFAELVERFAGVVDRHEVEHQIDFRRGLIPVPAPLRELLGVAETVDLAPTSAAVRCRDELSAILASIASAPAMPRTVLTIALEPVFNRTLWSTPHALAGTVILDGLASALGASASAPMASTAGFNRRSATELYLAVMRHGEGEIVTAARSLWERLFDATLPAPELEPWREATVWDR
jgi:hypothetical protein